TNSSFTVDDVWVLSNANGLGGIPTWTQLAPSGTSAPARDGHTAVIDATSNTMTIFGGVTAGGLSNDVWQLPVANGAVIPTWMQLTPSGTPPPARQRHTAVYNTSTKRMTIFAGSTGTFP